MAPIRRSPIEGAVEPLLPIVTGDSGGLSSNHYAKVISTPYNIALLDESDHGKIMIHGRAGAQAVAALSLEAPAEVGQGRTAVEGIAVYRLRADQLFVSTPPDQEAVIYAALLAATGERVTITDVTHGRAQLRLVGAASAEVLSRLCGLDLSPGHVPNHTAQQTSMAKTTQLVIRSDLAGGKLSYVLIGARSLGEYLWRSLLAAGGDLGIEPAGRADLLPPADSKDVHHG